MEQNLAILFADLSGYTALTETHGAVTAADTIDKYLEIVKDCLAGESVLHQCIGDEVVIISSSPDDLTGTALMMIHKCSMEHNFLQLHGGLHYGKLLLRNNNYFGSTINVASRIAAKAEKGKFWCSSEFVNALSADNYQLFHSKGTHVLKNVSEEVELFELEVDDHSEFCIDPVCRMLIRNRNKGVSHPGENIIFCSQNCMEIYLSRISIPKQHL